MDIAENLEYSYEEQCFLQIERLRGELNADDSLDIKRWQKHRLFRQNIYDPMDSQRKQYLERLLSYNLKCLGRQLHDNLREIARNSQASDLQTPNALLIVDRTNMANYHYDNLGVIHLKPKKQIKFNSAMLSKQAFILHIIAKVLKLIERQDYMTQRELYYLSLEFCRLRKTKPLQPTQNSNSLGTQLTATQTSQQIGSQRNTQTGSQSQQSSQNIKYNSSKLEKALNDLCCLLGCSKVHLHVLTQSKGIVYGNLKFKLKTGEVYDCLSKKEGFAIPTANIPIVKLESDARFVLVVEKDSVLQRILNQESTMNFVRDYKVILFTGKGYPDVASRAFVNYLWSRLKIPVLIIADADPHGIEIVCSYKFGCYSTAYEGRTIATPQIKWLGLLPIDVSRLALPQSKTLPLSHYDIRKINSLIARPYLKNKSAWIDQLNLMRASGRKAELEVLDGSGEYLVKTYLPNKLRYASWL